MKSLYSIFVLLCLVGFHLFAKPKDPKLNDLKKLVEGAVKHPDRRADTLTIDHLITLAQDSYESAPDSTLFYANLAIKLSKAINYKMGMANGYVQLASVNTFKSDYRTATNNYNKAVQLYGEINSKFGISEAYIGLARVQDYLGNYNAAINLFDKALNIRKKLGNKIDIANCYALVGITYDNKGDLSKALDCYFKSLTIDIIHKDRLGAADNYCNIGVIMQHLELYPKALNYYEQAYAIWTGLNDKQGISTASQNIGEVWMAQKNHQKALPYFRRAYAIYHQMDDREGISLIYYDLGLYHSYTGRPDSAIYYLNEALRSASNNKIKYNKAYAFLGLAQVYNQQKAFQKAYTYAVQAQGTAHTLGSLNTKADATLQLSKALAGLGNFAEAYKQQQLYGVLKDSLKNNEAVQKLISYNMEVEFGKRQHDETVIRNQKDALYQQKIKQQQRTNIIYALAMIGMGALALIYYKAKRRQQQANALLAEKNTEVLAQKADLDLQARKLNDLNILKDRLIGVLAHDIRAPLSTLRGLFALMTADGITHEEFISMSPKVFSKLEYTSDFLDTLLFWINSQVDDIQNTVKSFCLCDLVQHELLLLDEQFKAKNIQAVNMVTSGHTVLADPNSIRIVIHNFLSNALKFSNRDSIIEIGASINNNQRVLFTVTDHGIGMSNDQLNALFKTRMVSSPGTANETGTGMGLIFCKDLVEKYNGNIWAKSAPQTGTELGFALPADSSAINKPVAQLS